MIEIHGSCTISPLRTTVNKLIIALLSITFLGTGGFLVIRYKLFKMAVCQEITTVTLNLFLIFSACLVNDINIFDYTVLLLALIAAETAMALSLIIGSRGLSGRLSVRNNVSNYSTYLPKCQRLLSGPLGLRHPSGAVHMAPSYICYMDNCFCNE